MTADRATLLRAAAAAVELQRRRQAYPLAYATLWRPACRACEGRMVAVGDGWACEACGGLPEPRTSQQGALAAGMGRPIRLGFVRGGNRSGKSECGAMWAIAQALGGDHPHVRAWLRANDLPATIPPGPGLVWAVALTFPDSRRYVRSKLKRYAPEGSVFWRWDMENEAELRLPGGGIIVCKAWTQGREGMQGDSIRAAWCDEEPPDEAAFDEVAMRLVDQSGRMLVTMTPLSGMTWVYHKHVQRAGLAPEVCDRQITGLDNPYVPRAELEALLARLTSAARRARQLGEFVPLEGRVFEVWGRATHVIPARPLPAEWRRFRSIDFGTRNPFCCLWGAHDPADDVLHIYRQHYLPNLQTRRHGELINDMSKGEVIEWTVADPEDRQGRITLAAECDMPTLPAYKGVRESIDAVNDRLALDAEGRPHLVVHDCCRDLIREMDLYRWGTAEGKEAVIKQDDHAVDALRYMVLMMLRIA